MKTAFLILLYIFTYTICKAQYEYIDEQNKAGQFPIKSYQIDNGPEIDLPAVIVLKNDTLFFWQRVPTFNGFPSVLPYELPINPARTIVANSRMVYIMESPWGVDNRVVIDDTYITLEIPYQLESGHIKIVKSRLRRFYRIP